MLQTLLTKRERNLSKVHFIEDPNGNVLELKHLIKTQLLPIYKQDQFDVSFFSYKIYKYL